MSSANQERALAILSPLAVLGRGYSLTRLPSGAVVRRAADVARGDIIEILLREGTLGAHLLQGERHARVGEGEPQEIHGAHERRVEPLRGRRQRVDAHRREDHEDAPERDEPQHLGRHAIDPGARERLQRRNRAGVRRRVGPSPPSSSSPPTRRLPLAAFPT